MIIPIKIFQQTNKTTQVKETQINPPLKPPSKIHEQSIITLPGKRIVVNVTPEYLTGFFNGHTNMQGQKLAEPFAGKWLRICAPLLNVIDCKDFLFVQLYKTSSNLSIYTHFGKDWVERISVLRVGEDIKVFGQIKEISHHSISLENCELVENS